MRWKAFDRDQGRWRGPVDTIDPELLTSEASWREALADADIPRDIDRWLPAVVLSVGDTAARIGIEGVAEDADGHFIPAEDVTWARPVDAENGNAGNRARVAGDLLAMWVTWCMCAPSTAGTARSAVGPCGRSPRCRAASWRWT